MPPGGGLWSGRPRETQSEAQADEFFRREDVPGSHTLAAEAHAFGFQPHPLFERGFGAQADLAAGAEHAMPREAIAAPAEQLNDQPVVERIAGGGSHGGIGRDAAARDAADHIEDGFVARGVLAPLGAAQRALEFRVAAFHTPQQ